MAQDAVELIKSDHRKVEGLFDEFEQAGERAGKTKQRLVGEIIKELDVHSAIEEELFYPAVAEQASKDGKEMVLEAEEEHHVVKVLLDELRLMDPRDEHFNAKVMVLAENVRQHIEEEEGELLPRAEKLLGKEFMRTMGERLAQRKRQLMSA